MARLLFIVARDQPGLLEFLRRDFALEVVQGNVEIFIDRRTSRPGQVVQAHRAEGRDRPPASTADVQVIVRLAGQHGMSLWPTDQYRTECRARRV